MTTATATTTPEIIGRFTVHGVPGVEICRTKYREDGDWVYYPLTTCCQATGKGMEYETGVGCRACYEEVDGIFGSAWTHDEFQQEIANRLVAPEVPA